MDFVEWIKNFWEIIFLGKMAEITPIQFALFVLLCAGAFLLVKGFITKILWPGLKAIGRWIANGFSAKRRCSHVQCPHCGRTLDKCTCVDNKHRGYMSRLYHHNKEQRAKKKEKE